MRGRIRRLIAAAAALTLGVGLSATLAAPANAAPGNPAPLRIDYVNNSGPAGHASGLAVVTCLDPDDRDVEIACTGLPGLEVSADLTELTSVNSSTRLLRWNMPLEVGPTSGYIGMPGYEALTMPGQVYAADLSLSGSFSGRDDFGATHRGYSQLGDTSGNSYEIVMHTDRGTVAVSERIGQSQQYRIPNVKNTDTGLRYLFVENADGARKLVAAEEPFFSQDEPDLGPWTLGQTTMPYVKLPSSGMASVAGVTTCRNVDDEAVACIGGADAAKVQYGFDAGTGVASIDEDPAPGTQFDWGVPGLAAGDHTVQISLFDDRSSPAAPLSTQSKTFTAWSHKSTAPRLLSAGSRADALQVRLNEPIEPGGSFSVQVKDANGQDVGTVRDGIVHGAYDVTGLQPRSIYFVTWSGSYFDPFANDLHGQTYSFSSSFWMTTKSVLEAPTMLAWHVDGGDIVLTWDEPDNASSFNEVSYSVQVGGTKHSDVTSPYRIEGAAANTDLEVAVTAHAAYDYGNPAASEPAEVVVRRSAAPNAPVDVEYSAADDEVTWTKPAQIGDQVITGFELDAFRNGVQLGDTYEVPATEATSYKNPAYFTGLPAGVYTGTIRTVAGDERSEPVEMLRISVDLSEPDVEIVDGELTFAAADGDEDAIGGWTVSIVPRGGSIEAWSTTLDADESSVTLPTTLPVGLYDVIVTALPVDGFDYEAGSATVEWDTRPAPPKDDEPQGEPKPGKVVLGKLTAPDFSPVGGQKVTVTGTVTRDGKPVAGQKVTVKHRKVKGEWETKKVTTDAKGRYSITVKTDRAFRVIASLGDQSTKKVWIRPTAKVALTVNKSKVRVTTVGYAKKAPKVKIQARKDGRWVTVARGRDDRTIKVDVAAGTKLRAVSEKTKFVKSGTSKAVRAL